MNNEDLSQVAKAAMKNSYSPYSHFQVGAAVLCADGSVYKGCNIENASYGATICAERVALNAAISDGNKNIEKIAIVSASNQFTFPCGICRQVMAEFMQEDGMIILADDNKIKVYRLGELLPDSFQFHP